MKKFRIIGKFVIVLTYEVEAENENDALDMVYDAEADPIKQEEIDLDIDSVEEIQ